MTDTSAERIGHNNSLFREANDELSVVIGEHGFDAEQPAPFLCECSDPRCMQIVRLTGREYQRVRSNPRWFAHAPGHEVEVDGAVKLVERYDRYLIVEKVGEAGGAASEFAGEREAD